MDAVILYLKDGKNGKVEVVMELVGDPGQSFLIGNAIVNNLWGSKERHKGIGNQ